MSDAADVLSRVAASLRKGKAAVSPAERATADGALNELVRATGAGALPDARIVAALRQFYDVGGDASRISALNAAERA